MQAAILHPDDAPQAAEAVLEAIRVNGQYKTEYRIRVADGERWILASGKPSYDTNGAVTGMTGLVQDVTARKQEQLALAEEVRALEIINQTGAFIAAQLDLDRIVRAVVDAGVKLTEAAFGAFFYAHVGGDGEKLLLYVLSGAPREAFRILSIAKSDGGLWTHL